MVLLYIAVLLPCGPRLRAHTPTRVVHAARFLHADYKAAFFFWEPIELVRRTVLIGWVLRISAEDEFLRLVVALLLSIVSLTVVLAFTPYARADDNLLASVCQLTIIICFIGATYIRLYTEFILYSGEAVAQQVMYFSSTVQIFLPMLLLVLAVSTACLVNVFVLLLNASRQPLIHLVSTKALPELSMLNEHKWHLFLSHTVSVAMSCCMHSFQQPASCRLQHTDG